MLPVAALLLGIILCMGGIIGIVKQDTASRPKSNDHRIVKHRDGTYSVQYYADYSAWHTFQGTYKTQQDAQHLIDLLDGKLEYESPKDVVEILPVQPRVKP